MLEITTQTNVKYYLHSTLNILLNCPPILPERILGTLLNRFYFIFKLLEKLGGKINHFTQIYFYFKIFIIIIIFYLFNSYWSTLVGIVLKRAVRPDFNEMS